MITLSAPSGASPALAHAIELVNRDLDGALENLPTHRQNEFFTDLERFAQGRAQNPGRVTQLIVSEHVNAAVREALEMFDERTTVRLRELEPEDASQFWRLLHDACRQQARDTKHPKARHGGGGESA